MIRPLQSSFMIFFLSKVETQVSEIKGVIMENIIVDKTKNLSIQISGTIRNT